MNVKTSAATQKSAKKRGKNRGIVQLLLWLLIILLTLSAVQAIGIRPAKTSLIAAETSAFSGTVWVINNDAWEFDAKVYVEGEMGQYVTLKTEELRFRADTDSLPVDFSINLPSQIPPGTSTANIVIEQNVQGGAANTISSRVILKHKIILQGEYPEKYVVVSLNFQESGDQMEFISEVENLGRQDIGQVKTTFYVNDKSQNGKTVETEAASLASQENKLLKGTLEKSLFELGEFEVSAVTDYDGQQVEVVKKLVVGMPKVEVTYFDHYFTAHKINEYTMDLLNHWNKNIKNVFVEVEVKKDNQQIDEFRTKSVDLEAELSKRMTDYYDARQRSPGKYTFDLIVNFWNMVKMDQQTYQFETEFLNEKEFEEIKSRPQEASPQEVSSEGSDSSSAVWLWVALSLVLLAGGAFAAYRYLHRSEYEQGEGGL